MQTETEDINPRSKILRRFGSRAERFREHLSSEQDDSIQSAMSRFLATEKPLINVRYRSWNTCLKHFDPANRMPVSSLCRDLYVFLSSWGYTGTINLPLPSDARFLQPMVEAIINDDFTPLWTLTPPGLCEKANQKLLILASMRIAARYTELKPFDSEGSDMFATYVMSATSGCIVPFSASVRKGMRVLGISPDTLSVGTLVSLSRFHAGHADEIEILRAQLEKDGCRYTAMNVLGFALQDIGSRHLGDRKTT